MIAADIDAQSVPNESLVWQVKPSWWPEPGRACAPRLPLAAAPELPLGMCRSISIGPAAAILWPGMATTAVLTMSLTAARWKMRGGVDPRPVTHP